MARYQIIRSLAGLSQPTASPRRSERTPTQGWAANSNRDVEHILPIWTGDGFGPDGDDSRWICRSID